MDAVTSYIIYPASLVHAEWLCETETRPTVPNHKCRVYSIDVGYTGITMHMMRAILVGPTLKSANAMRALYLL